MASIARQYYLQGVSKSDIAERLGLSRFKVARLLDRALDAGLVRIQIGWPGAIDVALSAAVQERFALTRAVVVNLADEQSEAVRRGLGEAAAALLGEIVTADDVLGLAWGRSLTAMAAALTRLAGCEVVQLTGALQREDTQASSVDLVRDVARIGGGPAYFFHAPMIVADGQIARALRQQPEVARAIDRFACVTKAFVGIGAWEPGQSTVWEALSAHEAQALAEAGVAAEISGILIDPMGRPVPSELEARTIGIRPEQLRRIPDVTALAWSAQKAPAVLAALSSGLISGLVTTRDLGEALLRLPVAEVGRV